MNSNESNSNRNNAETESIAVIGCGPGGMFFCHALEAKKRQLLEQGASIDHLPRVTVFERADSPGGVWRSARNHTESTNNTTTTNLHQHDHDRQEEKKESDASVFEEKPPLKSTQMYEALWTNGPKEGVEFFDYTYQDHFQRPLPVYMPRRALLEYMLTRVTKDCPTFFEQYVQFETTVINVMFDDVKQKFRITTTSNATSGDDAATRPTATTRWYDRCIWAAGDNGQPNMPASVLQTLRGYTGKILHSTDTATLQDDVAGKRILLIGGSYSAEDLALMACKLGATQIYVASRSAENAVSWTKEWPRNAVHPYLYHTPIGIENGTTVVLKQTEWIKDEIYQIKKDGTEVRLDDIDTIIMCTGYRKQFDMLDPPLYQWIDNHTTLTFPVPDDWTMDENKVTPYFGHVPKPTVARYYGSTVVYGDLYRGMLIENPRMMFLRHEFDDYPILNIDSLAWLMVQFVTGERRIPSSDEMRQENIQQALLEMKKYPYARFYMDPSYGEAWLKTPLGLELEDEYYYKTEAVFLKYEFQIMARTMEEGQYPLSLGTYEALNKTGRKLHKYGYLSYYHRAEGSSSEKTFRDVEDAHKFTSIFTGIQAVPLKKPWLEIDENNSEEELI